MLFTPRQSHSSQNHGNAKNAFFRLRVQAKLEVDSTNSVAEKEADNVADKVVQRSLLSDAPAEPFFPSSNTVQRKPESETNEKETAVQEVGKEEKIQQKTEQKSLEIQQKPDTQVDHTTHASNLPAVSKKEDEGKDNEKEEEEEPVQLKLSEVAGNQNSEAVSETNPAAPTGDPFFEPTERGEDKDPARFEHESGQAVQNQLKRETNQAASEVPVSASIEKGKPTVLEPKNTETESEKSLELGQENGESPADVSSLLEGEGTATNNGKDAKEVPPVNGKEKDEVAQKGGKKEGSELDPVGKSLDLPTPEPDSAVHTIEQLNNQAPSSADQAESETDKRSEEEKANEQARLAAEFQTRVETTKSSIQQKTDLETANIRNRELLATETIRQNTLQQSLQISSIIALKKAEIQQGYAQTRQLLETQKQTDLVRIETTKSAKLALLSAEMESRRTAFNIYVDEQTLLPTVNATNEANRADNELEQAAVEALAEGESVARQHPKSDDGHPEARDSVRQIARETAADLRKSKVTIREDLLKTASEFNGGFEQYRTDIQNQINSTEVQLITAINDAGNKFVDVIHEAYTNVMNTLEQKETQDLQALDELETRQLAATQENEQNALNSVGQIANSSVEELQRASEYILQMIDDLGANVAQLLAPGDGIPIMSTITELQQNSLGQLSSIETDGMNQLNAIVEQSVNGIDQVLEANTQANESALNAINEQSTQLATASSQQRDQTVTQLRTTLDSSFTSMETSLDEMRTEALSGLDEAIEERKGKIQQANDEFLAELISQNNEHIETAKQPLTDPLISRLWSAADRATASWWEGLLAAIGDFLVMLIIIVAFAALLVVMGVFSTITGALLVIGAVLLTIMFIAALVSRLGEGRGWLSLPLAIADTLGITMIYQGVTNRYITGGEMNMNTFDRWYSGTTGTLQFITIILPFKSRIPGLRSLRMPRIFGEPNGRGPAGWINRGVRWIEGIGRNTRTREVNGVPVERPSLADRAWTGIKNLWPFGRRPAPAPDPVVDPVVDEPPVTEEPTASTRRGRARREAHARELAAQKLRAEARLNEVEAKATEVDRVITQRTTAADAQGEFGQVLAESRGRLTTLQRELVAIREQIASAESHNRITRLMERLAELEGQIDALSNRVVGTHGMRRETSDALRRLEELKNDPVGDVNSEPDSNHYGAARTEARNEPLLRRDGSVVLRPDGSPYSHIRDLQNAHDALVNVRRQLDLELNNPSPDLTDTGIQILFNKLSETNALINRLGGFLNEIGWPPSRPHRWVQRDGVWTGEGDIAILRPRARTRVDSEITRTENTRNTIARLRDRVTMEALFGRRANLITRLRELQTQLEAATTEARIREIMTELDNISREINNLERDIYNAQ